MTRAHSSVAAIALLLACIQAEVLPRADGSTGSVSSTRKARWKAYWSARKKPALPSPLRSSATSMAASVSRRAGCRPDNTHCVFAPRATISPVKTVELRATPADVAITLAKTFDLAAQLTNTEWLMSMPGTAEQKRPLMECMSCHTLERIARSAYNAEEFVPVLERMAQYANNTIQARVQTRVAPTPVNDALVRKLAAYLTTINLSSAPVWNYELKTLPRPHGRATHVVVTEYDLAAPDDRAS